MSKKMSASLALFALALTLVGVAPGAAAIESDCVAAQEAAQVTPVAITHCFPGLNAKADCMESQQAATCVKSGCYPSEEGKWCYDCYLSDGTAGDALEDFLAWLNEGTQEE